MTTIDYDYMRSGAIVDGALPKASFVFDLDGTLVDSVYQHVLAWRTALESEGINLSVWRIHRKIGMSGGLFTNMLLRETAIISIPRDLSGCAGCMRPSSIITQAKFNLYPGRATFCPF
jgi:hypothetical protein